MASLVYMTSRFKNFIRRNDLYLVNTLVTFLANPHKRQISHCS